MGALRQRRQHVPECSEADIREAGKEAEGEAGKEASREEAALSACLLDKMSDTSKRIEGRLSAMRGPYPTADVRRIAPGSNHGAFAGNLELYFDCVYSYSSSLERLHRKSREELVEIRQRLSTSVFDRHHEYERY